MEAYAENKNKYFALGLTVLFHAILFLIFILVVFVTPIPPFEVKPVPEIEIGLGMQGLGNADAGGSGKHDPEVATKPETPVVTKTQPVVPTPSPDKVVTDETGENVNIVKTEPKKKPKKEKTVVTKTPPKPVEEKASSELSDALAILKSKKKHVGEGDGGSNRGGSGTGTSGGVGGGSSTGHGNGTPGYNGLGGPDLKGRLLLRKPAPMTDPEEEGIVVVEIIVDENGKVIKATPGQRGSTTFSSNLYSKARQAAMQAKFNPSPSGAKEQRGTYTFVFTLE
jgi:periplasmic protein TonB